MADEFDQNPEPADVSLPASGGTDGGGSDAPAQDDAPPPSLRDTILAARDEVAAKERGETPVPGQPRAADGKFAPKSTDQPTTAAPRAPATATPAPTAAKPGETTTAPAADALAAPPNGWSPEAKTEWSKVPPAVQAAVAKREQDFARGIAQHQEFRQSFEQVMAPYRHAYADKGVSDVQAIGNLWTWFDKLGRNPGEAFPELAQLFGFDLSSLSGDIDAGGDIPTNDPRIVAMQRELQSLRSQVGQVTTANEQRSMAQTQAHLQSWAKDKPYFESVKVAMGYLMSPHKAPDGRTIPALAKNLDEAYDQAIHANPQIRAEILAQQQAAATAATLKRPSANPQAAAVSPRGSAPNGAVRPNGANNRSLREDILAARAEVEGRA